MKLYLIRHAESENNAKPIHERIEDPPITDLGRQQAQRLAAWIETLPIDVLITSPVLRALQTTHFIATSTGAHVHVWDNVFEEGGIYRGHGPEAIEGGPGLGRMDVIRHLVDSDADRCTLDASIVDTGWWAERNRETPSEAQDRARRVTVRLVETFGNSESTIVAVIHADFKRRLLTEMIRWKANPIEFGNLQNTGITKLLYDGDRFRLDWFNSVSHLPPQWITGNET